MATITTRDGTEIFYKDWGSRHAAVFRHGWPLNADARDDQVMLVESGFRAVAHGRSSQRWTGHELDAYADDLAQLIEQLDLREVVLVGHSTGGEVTRYLGRHGSARVAKALLQVDPDANSGGLPKEERSRDLQDPRTLPAAPSVVQQVEWSGWPPAG